MLYLKKTWINRHNPAVFSHITKQYWHPPASGVFILYAIELFFLLKCTRVRFLQSLDSYASKFRTNQTSCSEYKIIIINLLTTRDSNPNLAEQADPRIALLRAA